MSYANASTIHAAVVALDQEKPFDRVDWNFLFKVQKLLGYEGKRTVAARRRRGVGKK